jgi:hypothetical protein
MMTARRNQPPQNRRARETSPTPLSRPRDVAQLTALRIDPQFREIVPPSPPRRLAVRFGFSFTRCFFTTGAGRCGSRATMVLVRSTRGCAAGALATFTAVLVGFAGASAVLAGGSAALAEVSVGAEATSNLAR